jgi:hypothetical protein
VGETYRRFGRDLRAGVTGVSGRLLFGFQRAFTFCVFGPGALGLNRSVAVGLLCTFWVETRLNSLGDPMR